MSSLGSHHNHFRWGEMPRSKGKMKFNIVQCSIGPGGTLQDRTHFFSQQPNDTKNIHNESCLCKKIVCVCIVKVRIWRPVFVSKFSVSLKSWVPFLHRALTHSCCAPIFIFYYMAHLICPSLPFLSVSRLLRDVKKKIVIFLFEVKHISPALS